MDKHLTSITVGRIMHAKKWKVVRLMTKVWEFPSFIPCVKEVSVIEKSLHSLKTKWRIELDGVPISWVEEDILALKDNMISFSSIEGDMQAFKGEWSFKDHPQGTEVTANVYLRVDIPAIKDFTETYVKRLLLRNFEAILEGIEQRLVSIRYAAYRRGDTNQIAGFGIIGHLYNFNHLAKCLKMMKPDYKMPSKEFLSQLFYMTPSFKLYDIRDFKSKTGQMVNGCGIIATFIPEMIEKDVWAVFSKVVRACKLAEKYGVGIVSLGGFTSIVGEKISREMSSQVDVPVTTGNTFTAAMAIDGIFKAADMLDIDISSAKMAIIGGTGDIGSACARVFAEKMKQLTITGRTKSNLNRLRNELKRKRKAKIIATIDNQSAVKDADIIIGAASASASILEIDWFKSGAIICDIGYPKNVSYRFNSRRDILIFSGGLSRTPSAVNIPIDIGLPAADTIYGYITEAIILSLEKRYESFSIGRGKITEEKIDEIRTLGKKHGFELADFYWGDKLIDKRLINNIKEAVSV